MEADSNGDRTCAGDAEDGCGRGSASDLGVRGVGVKLGAPRSVNAWMAELWTADEP